MTATPAGGASGDPPPVAGATALTDALTARARAGVPSSVVLIDVDRLTEINGALGTASADALLVELAERLCAHLRPDDAVVRLGGGTFGLVLPGASRLDGLLVAERLRAAVARAPLGGCAVSVSAGVAAFPDDGVSARELEVSARRALAWAKDQGRNLCAVASEVGVEIGHQDGADVLAHLNAVVASIDARELQTRDHSVNVAAYAVATCQRLGLPESHTVSIRRAAFLHDIGKIAVDQEILAKPGRLTDAEFAQIQIHPVVGARMVHHGGLVDEARWIRHHHERLDGRGYPDGLVGDEIPLESRIIFVADAFEAMTSDRPYRRGLPVPDAVDEVRACAGTQFDADIAEVFCGLVECGIIDDLSLRD